MPLNLERFRTAYDKWVEESLPDYQAGKMEHIIKTYPFVVPDDIPWTPYTGDPATKTFALLSSGGLYLKESQPAFDTASIHGDISFREIPKTVQQQDLGIAHKHYDHGIAEQDINTIFPIHRFIELEQEAVIGALAETHYSFSYVNNAVGLVEKTVPELISRLKVQAIDVLFLVPV